MLKACRLGGLIVTAPAEDTTNALDGARVVVGVVDNVPLVAIPVVAMSTIFDPPATRPQLFAPMR